MSRPRIDFYEKEAKRAAENSKNRQVRTDATVVLELIRFIRELEADITELKYDIELKDQELFRLRNTATADDVLGS